MNGTRGICFLTGTLEAFAGAERMTATVASALAARGFRVHVLSLWGRSTVFPLHPGVRHDALFDTRPSFRLGYLRTVRDIREYCRTQGIDTLVEVDTMLTLFTLPACLGLGVRRISWEHCHFGEDLGAPLRRLARRLAARTNAAIVVLTEADRRQWMARARPRAPVVALPNPLPFPYPAQATWAQESRIVLAVGRLTPAKGFDDLIQAWSIAQNAMVGWTLRIVGEGEQRGELEQLAARLGVAESVQLPGTTSAVEQEYRQAAMFCLSSRYEGFGLVLVEAMAHGLPVVSTNCEAGPRSLLRNEDNALVVTPGDVAGLAQAILRLASPTSVDLRLALAGEGRKDAAAFELEAVVDRWIPILSAPSAPSVRT